MSDPDLAKAVRDLQVGDAHEPERLDSSGFAHGKPAPGMECLCSMEDITEEDANYVEFRTAPSETWHPCHFSSDVVRSLLRTQFRDYVEAVRKADCAADLKRRIGSGPPIWVADKHAMPLPEGDTHVERLWFAGDGHEYCAKLAGALEGETRQKLWDELAAFLPPEESAPAPAQS
mmetsp:Transcript_19821/g.65543  ORF Transcript_19821/g.65543 Transcript_19821/m.65543 type:complete len:175 (+) Transcript_19821:94-618(+)